MVENQLRISEQLIIVKILNALAELGSCGLDLSLREKEFSHR